MRNWGKIATIFKMIMRIRGLSSMHHRPITLKVQTMTGFMAEKEMRKEGNIEWRIGSISMAKIVKVMTTGATEARIRTTIVLGSTRSDIRLWIAFNRPLLLLIGKQRKRTMVDGYQLQEIGTLVSKTGIRHHGHNILLGNNSTPANPLGTVGLSIISTMTKTATIMQICLTPPQFLKIHLTFFAQQVHLGGALVYPGAVF